MNKLLFFLLAFIIVNTVAQARNSTSFYHVADKDINRGIITEKIWLDQYALPAITISGLQYRSDVSRPTGVTPGDPNKFSIILGKERKRAFALVSIPVYLGDATALKVNQLTDFSLNVTEEEVAGKSEHAAAKTTATTNSVLSKGTWYKIAVPATGIYKIDYNLIKKLGLNPANINPANIRILGNGGNMLPEDNAQARKKDLVENAAWASDNGDNVFDNNEFIAFYAVGPTAWLKDSINKAFSHQNNLYSDSSYYFVSVDQGAGLRIASQAGAPSANVTVTSFNDYAVHDTDITNPGGFGKEWYGEEFTGQSAAQSFSFSFGTTVSAVTCKVLFDYHTASDNVTVSMNGQVLGVKAFNSDSPDYSSVTYSNNLNSTTANIAINYQSVSSSGQGYLNYIELNVRRPLGMTGTQMGFRDWESVGTGNVATYQLQNANSVTQVWDVTNPQAPVKMNGTLNNGIYEFRQDAGMLHEFVAMNSTDFAVPSYTGIVPNQNLHASPQANLIIVTYPGFIDAANQLADFHRQHDNMSVVVATTTQVYNEFSSGSQDISAIRDFTRMFYDNANNDTTQMPRYLLLFGGASYDYKNRVPNNSNFVPTFESSESHDDINSYCSDDFYGFLDDNEYIENVSIVNAFDIGVGRIPARSLSAALSMVNKIITYKSPASLGAWRLGTTFAADNNDGAGQHMDDAESMAGAVDTVSTHLYNETKVYVDAIPTVSTPGGARCPNANVAIDDHIYSGTFLINYNGHGNTQVWAGERILTQDDYNNWKNGYKLPFMVTATCDFGQFDHPQYVSAAEQLVMENNAGVIAALTTTQAVYAGPNHTININYLTSQFTRLGNGKWNAFGDAFRIGKNITYVTTGYDVANFRKFALLGDPALVPDFPEHVVHIDSLIDGVTMLPSDSVSALGSYVLKGSIKDFNGNFLPTFNGEVSVAFYDKPRIVNTISGTNENFRVQDNVIYKGKATVTNGLFSVAFIAPKDINYSIGNGKISTYAQNGVTDGAGSDNSFTVGGFSDHPVISANPPVVKPFMNDSLFINGGITGANSVLFVELFDETGINVSGNNVGHDLTAILDGNTEAPYLLNDYYETVPNTYKRGFVSFPIYGLADGKHSITVRAWDVNDNTGTGTVNFEVIDGKVVDVQNLMNYPNPFSDVTHFVFEHNHPNEQLEFQLYIYNTSGVLVHSIKQSFAPSGSRSSEITWDGTANGAKLPGGVYVYKLNVATSTGIQSTAYQKLVLIR